MVLKRVSASVPESVYEWIVTNAENEGRSISNQVAWLIEKGIAKVKEEQWREGK